MQKVKPSRERRRAFRAYAALHGEEEALRRRSLSAAFGWPLVLYQLFGYRGYIEGCFMSDDELRVLERKSQEYRDKKERELEEFNSQHRVTDNGDKE